MGSMSAITLLGALAALLTAQDPPKITLEKKGPLSEIVAELGRSIGPIAIDPKAEDRVLSLSLREAGYFEVLDALCGSHGDLRYYDPGHHWLTGNRDPGLRRGKPVERPTAYQGHFKFLLTQMTRIHSRSAEGEGTWVNLEVALLGPPFATVGRESGTSVRWKLIEARDAQGRDVLEPRGNAGEQITVRATADSEGNVADRLFSLANFDLDRGLALLRGEARLTAPEVKEVRVEVERGKEQEVPGGTVVVAGVDEYKPQQWAVALTFKPADPKASLKNMLAGTVTHEHAGAWKHLNIPSKGFTLEVRADLVPGPPQWVKLRFRTGDRVIVLPFEFRNARFGD